MQTLTIRSRASVNGVALTLYLISGIAQESNGTHELDPEHVTRENRGRFWIVHEDGTLTEIRVMRNLFTPQFGRRVWVLLYRDAAESDPARYALAGHVDGADVNIIVRPHLWETIILKATAPNLMKYWDSRIQASFLSIWLAPMAWILLFNPGPAPLLLSMLCSVCAVVYCMRRRQKAVYEILLRVRRRLHQEVKRILRQGDRAI